MCTCGQILTVPVLTALAILIARGAVIATPAWSLPSVATAPVAGTVPRATTCVCGGPPTSTTHCVYATLHACTALAVTSSVHSTASVTPP